MTCFGTKVQERLLQKAELRGFASLPGKPYTRSRNVSVMRKAGPVGNDPDDCSSRPDFVVVVHRNEGPQPPFIAVGPWRFYPVCIVEAALCLQTATASTTMLHPRISEDGLLLGMPTCFVGVRCWDVLTDRPAGTCWCDRLCLDLELVFGCL